MDWSEIRKEYETTDITLKALAEKYNVKLGTVKSRKSREIWSREATKKNATKKQKVATNRVRDATQKRKIKDVPEESLQSDNLTDKQRLFCMYYIKCFNATKAYKKAYECDYMTAMPSGSRLLRNVKVSDEIDRMKAEQAKGIMLDAQFVLQKYIDIAFADITDFATFGKKEVQAMGAFGPVEDDDGNPVMVEVNYVDFKESIEIDGTIITEVKKGKDGVSIKLADKMKALDKLAQYFDLFPDKFKQEIEKEKLKISKDKFELEKKKVIGDDDETEDDGFLEALEGKVSEVWDDVEED